ncbi:MAG: hypothetical protein LBV65_03820 [Desulfovibrio sp.]|jgi:hypothetical protein|nr:hypothetical protein [Desulfovibrio sp.]
MRMLIHYFQPLTDIFDYVHHVWERPVTQRRVALIILWLYLAALGGIELNRMGVLPPWLAVVTPLGHFYAIHLAFTFILVLEVMALILTISSSIGRSVGKQFEILALILLRNAFKELGALPEPVTVAGNLDPILHIIVSGAGALFIFACLCVYNRIFRSQGFIHAPDLRMRYVMTKKLLALFLFVIFLGLVSRDVYLFFTCGGGQDFFEIIYTVLIFADIALVLIAQRYMPTFHAVFRNSGFVIGTLLMRLSFSAAVPWDTVVSSVAALYILALTWVTNHFMSHARDWDKGGTP